MWKRSDTSTADRSRFGEPERPRRVGRGEDREAARLEPPELRVVNQVGERVGDRRDLGLRGPRLDQLTLRLEARLPNSMRSAWPFDTGSVDR
jgi:hypothetical protein